MLSLVAQWTGVDPFRLGQMTFGGSGYDIACATAEGPILYSKKDNNPVIQSIDFDPPFKDQILFVHLGRKQDTQEALQLYQSLDGIQKSEIQNQIHQINQRILNADSIQEFINALDDHENLISQHLNLPKVKDLYFSDFKGSVKSLGAWGGDFVMAVGEEDVNKTITYFQTKEIGAMLLWSKLF